MPRYTPNQQNNSATFYIFPLNEYEFIIGEAKPFFNAGKEAVEGQSVKKEDNYGVRYVLTCAEGPHAGKKYIKNCYLHSSGAEDFTKQFMLAAHGFGVTNDEELLFNDKIVNMDQAFNTEDGSAGDYWTSIKGGRIKGSLTVAMYQGKQKNEEKSWAPVKA